MDTDIDVVIGDPDYQEGFWQQQSLPDDCAVMAQVSLLQQFGIDISEETAVYECAECGWYMPGSGGTAPSDVGNLMELHGVGTHQVANASVADLAAELQQGHGVIVGVRSGELWDSGPGAVLSNWLCENLGLDNSQFNPADHAVVVTGIDMSNPDDPQVILNDSGTPDGQGHAYPLDQFMDAWENSDFFYTATDSAIPHDDSVLGDLSLLDMGQWLVGGIVAGVTIGETGDIMSGIACGMDAAAALEDLFASEDCMRLV